MERLNYQYLLYFWTVAKEGSIAMAAERLRLTQPTISVQIRKLEDALETRKLVERAKEVLMRRRNTSGSQAYRWIQKRSMDSRKSILHVAEAVLLSDEL